MPSHELPSHPATLTLFAALVVDAVPVGCRQCGVGQTAALRGVQSQLLLACKMLQTKLAVHPLTDWAARRAVGTNVADFLHQLAAGLVAASRPIHIICRMGNGVASSLLAVDGIESIHATEYSHPGLQHLEPVPSL